METAPSATSAAESIRAPAEPSLESARASDQTVASRNSGEELALRLTSCLSNPLDDERQLEFLSALKAMHPDDAGAFLAALEPFRRQGARREEWSAFFRKWGELNSAAAIAYLDQHKSENWAPDSYQQVLRSWGMKEPAAAQTWLNERSGEVYFEAALLGFLEGHAVSDHQAATQIAVSSLAGAPDRLVSAAMEKIATSVFRSSFAPGLQQWFAALPTGPEGEAFRRGAMRHVYSRLVQKDATTAAEWLSAQATMPWRSDGLIAEHAARLASKDPAAAMNWVASMPPSPRIGVVMGVGEIVREWSRDAGSFEPWLETVRGTQVFEQAARDYAILIAKQNPNKALFWAKQVTNPHWHGEAMQAAKAAGAQ